MIIRFRERGMSSAELSVCAYDALFTLLVYDLMLALSMCCMGCELYWTSMVIVYDEIHMCVYD